MKTNFNLKKKKSLVETPIMLIVRWDNNKLTYSTQEAIKPQFWEDDRSKKNYQRAKEIRQFPEYPEFNYRLNYVESTTKNIFRKFLNDHDSRPPRVDELKKLLDIKLRKVEDKQKKDFFGFIEQLISDAKSRFNTKTGKQLAKGTIVIYQNAFNVLKEYAKRENKRIDYDMIDLNFYHEYTEYLSRELNFANNTIGRHIKTIKSWLNDAAERDLHTNYSYKSKKFKVITENTESIYLNEEELDQLFKLDLSNNTRLEKVRDLFLVGCWTGLRFSDFSNIQKKHIKEDVIEIQTQKTDQKVIIPINKTVRSIMDKYKGKYPNSLPPAISNVKTNSYLKEIGAMLECLHVNVETKITKGGVQVVSTNKKFELLVTHAARRSFATNLHKAGLSSLIIMKITGHRTEKAFMKYIKTTPKENAVLLQQHWLKKEKEESKIMELV
jgi:site-specific recombinase XerD